MRRPNIQRPISIHTTLPQDVWVKLSAHLYSEVEGRVPKGAYQAFFLERIEEFFAKKEVVNGERTESGTAV